MCFADTSDLMGKLNVCSTGVAFISYCLHCDDTYDDTKDKCNGSIELKDGAQITVLFNEKTSELKQTIRPFSPKQIMFGCTCHNRNIPEESFPMEMELGMWRIKIITLTIIADNIFAMIG